MSASPKRIAVTGMAINTPLADALDDHLTALLAGRSAITRWRTTNADATYSKIGGDLTGYDSEAKLTLLEHKTSIPPRTVMRARRLIAKAPWSVGLSVLLGAEAWFDSRISHADVDAYDFGVLIGGCYLQNRYHFKNLGTFNKEPDFIDPLYALHSIESTHAGCVSDILNLRGAATLVNAACASSLYALRVAVDEIRCHNARAVVVVGAVPDFSPMDLHALALIGAISQNSFNDEPHRASRPFDVRREGFVPAHGGGAIVVEDLDCAKERGAKIYCELVGVEITADASYLPQPSEEGQARAMQGALKKCGIAPEQIDYINGHFTSTIIGDVAEINAIKRVFGHHAYRLKTNATKSLIGHTMGASAIVELIGAILQMRAGRLHQTINVDQVDDAVDLEICAHSTQECKIRYFMKNAFGFGGLNASAIVAAPSEV